MGHSKKSSEAREMRQKPISMKRFSSAEPPSVGQDVPSGQGMHWPSWE